jgi:polysaccharide export outer membrane protein
MQIQHKLTRTFLLIFGLLVSFLAHAEYLLGPGDMVRISVYGNADLSTETRVTQEGRLTFPLLGEVPVGGLSVAQSEKKIATMLEQGGFIKQAQVNIVVLQFTSQQISILGDVLKPGRYPLERTSNLVEVLALAGGVNQNGSDMVTVFSQYEGTTKKHDYDLRDILRKGVGINIKVNSDDIIYVHAREVSVLGQVNRPGKYSIQEGVRSMVDFLSMAGGINSGGADTVTVLVFSNGKLERHEIDVDDLFHSGNASSNLELAAGDMIYVPRAPVFYIYGEVQRAGAFRLERNMTVAQALATGGGLTARGTERGLRIKRRNADGVLETFDAKAGDLLHSNDILFVRESLF